MAVGFIVRDGGATARTITAMEVRDGGATLRTIVEGRVRDANAVSRLFFDPSGAASFTVSPAPAFVVGTTLGTGTATTNSTTVTPTGGTGPYTYAWTVISYSHGTTSPTVTSPTAATTTFTQTNIAIGADYVAVFRCTVTDSLTATASCDVDATFTDTT